MKNSKVHARLAGLSTSLTGILVALLSMALVDFRSWSEMLDLLKEWLGSPPIVTAALVLLVNGLWMAPLLQKRFCRRNGQAFLMGVLSAWLSLALAVMLATLCGGIVYDGWDRLGEALLIYLFMTLAFGGLQAGLLGGVLGYYLYRKQAVREAASKRVAAPY